MVCIIFQYLKILRLGGFHMALNSLSLTVKRYDHSGHKLFQQAFLHLLWSSFAQWLKQSKNEEELEQLDVYTNMISEKVHLCNILTPFVQTVHS